jgi:hypothetical protein
MNPESNIVGIMRPARAKIIAVRWVGATVEMTIPNARAVMMYKPHSASSSATLPRIGTSKTVRAATNTSRTLTKASTM